MDILKQKSLKWTLSFVLFFFYAFASQAQSTESIRSGRPGQSIGPYSVGKGYLQVQTGFSLSEESMSRTDKFEVQSTDTVVRYGFSEKLEFSSLIIYQRDQILGGAFETSSTGLSRIDLGFRLNINSNPNGIIPALGFQTRIKLDTVSEEFRSNNITPIILIITHHKINETVSWIHNFGLNYENERNVQSYFWISNLSFSITKKIGAFVELYGDKISGTSNYFYDGGFSYLLNNDLQLDLFAGSDLNSGVSEEFYSLGISWRTNLLRNR